MVIVDVARDEHTLDGRSGLAHDVQVARPINSQPLPECAQVAPISTGTSPAATMRVFTPRMSNTPPIASIANTT